jgi:MFS family permease
LKRLIQRYKNVLKLHNVRLISLVTFFYSLTFYTTVYTLLLQDRGLDYWEIFLLESVLSAFIFLFEVPSGYLADRWGRKRVIVLAVGCYFLSSLVLVVAQPYWMFVMQAALYGIGVAAMSGTDSALLYEDLEQSGQKEEADHVFSLQSAVMTAAMIISLPVGGWIGARSFDSTVSLTCVAMLIAFLLTFFIREEGGHQRAERASQTGFLSTLRMIIRDHPLVLLLQLFMGLSTTAIFSLNYLQQPLFQSYGIGIESFGLIMLGSYGFNLLVTFFTPMLREWIGTRMIFFLSTLLPGGLFVVLGLTVQPVVGVGALWLIMAMQTIRGPLYRTFLNEQIEGENRITVLSVISFVGSIMGMCLKPLIGYGADQGLMFAFAMIGMLILLASCAVWALTTRLMKRVK